MVRPRVLGTHHDLVSANGRKGVYEMGKVRETAAPEIDQHPSNSDGGLRGACCPYT